MYKRKFHLYTSIYFMFVTGMTLSGFVVLSLWNSNVLKYEIDNAKLLLEIYSQSFISDGPLSSPPLRSQNNENTRVWYYSNQPNNRIPSHENISSETISLIETLKKATTTPDNYLLRKKAINRKLLPPQIKVTVCKKIPSANNKFTVVGLEKVIDTIYSSDRGVIKIIAFYFLFNALIFTTLLFYRVSASILKPVEQMVAYVKKDMHHYEENLDIDNLNELNQLSFYLKQMLINIRNDNTMLKANVEQLSSLNKELQQLREEAVRAEKLAAVGRLSSGLAHEIGNPLTITKGYLEMLTNETYSLEKSRDYANRAAKEVERIDLLIRQLLDYSRQSPGKKEKIDVVMIAREVIESLKFHRSMENITVKENFEANEIFAVANNEELRQVLINCLLNSLDAILDADNRKTPKISIHIHHQNSTEEKQVVIEIYDNGPGVATEDLGCIFDPFFTTKEPGRGVGLGLAVSWTMIKQAGGTMSLENLSSGGAKMSVILPGANK